MKIAENRRTSEYNVLLLKLADKLDLRRDKKKCCFVKS